MLRSTTVHVPQSQLGKITMQLFKLNPLSSQSSLTFYPRLVLPSDEDIPEGGLLADIAQLAIGVGGLVYGITSGAVAVTASYWNNMINLCFDAGDVAAHRS